MRKKVKRLTYEDRNVIEKMNTEKAKIKDIADIIGVHRATVYKELKRGGTPYKADIAQKTIR